MPKNINMSTEKVEMPELEPGPRAACFEEVAQGYTPEMAVSEAARCLNCPQKPCVAGCPVNVRIPEFIEKVAAGDFEVAYQIIAGTNSLPAICGRVCPQERQCEELCIRTRKGDSVGIGRLERFVADWHLANTPENPPTDSPNGPKVAIIGSGPASLACAGDLAKNGCDVTIFEAFHTPGGVLAYGIPEFRLPKEVLRREIAALETLGVKIELNMVIGKILTIDELFQDGFRAVFIGTGAGLPSFMGIPGENLKGVYSANEFLTRVNLMKGHLFPEHDTPVVIGRHVAVIGGGNVGIDAARCALRLGADSVTVVYRRSEREMPARLEEIGHAKEEGIKFEFLSAPVRVLGDDDGWASGLECVRMELGEPDQSERRNVTPVPGSEHVIQADTIIVAIGQTPNPLLINASPGLEATKRGTIVAHPDGATTLPHVYAGGDVVSGAATVILAMGAGKDAAASILRELQNELNSKI